MAIVEHEDMSPDEREELDKAKHEKKLRDEAEAAAWRKVLATSEGRRVLWAIMELTGMNEVNFVPGLADATAFNLGMRNVGVMVQARISETSADDARRMVLENWE